MAKEMSNLVRVIFSVFVVTIQVKCVEYGVYLQLIRDLIEALGESLKSLKIQLENSKCFPHQRVPWSLWKQLLRNQQNLNNILNLIDRINLYFAGPIFIIFYLNGITILNTINWAYVGTLYEHNNEKQICKSFFF